MINSLSFKKALEIAQSGTIDEVSNIPNEYLDEFNGWINEIETTVNMTDRYVRGIFAQAPKNTRKEFALWVNENYPFHAAYLFAIFDGKPIEPLIYKLAFKGIGHNDKI